VVPSLAKRTPPPSAPAEGGGDAGRARREGYGSSIESVHHEVWMVS